MNKTIEGDRKMEMEFFADLVTYEKGDESFLIGFSDNGDEPDKYLILERSYEFDVQDIELGMDTYYLEFSGNSGYGICKNVVLDDKKIYFFIKDKTLNDISKITVSYSSDKIKSMDKFIEILKSVLENNFEIKL
jgi:hypothetical protein